MKYNIKREVNQTVEADVVDDVSLPFPGVRSLRDGLDAELDLADRLN